MEIGWPVEEECLMTGRHVPHEHVNPERDVVSELPVIPVKGDDAVTHEMTGLIGSLTVLQATVAKQGDEIRELRGDLDAVAQGRARSILSIVAVFLLIAVIALLVIR